MTFHAPLNAGADWPEANGDATGNPHGNNYQSTLYSFVGRETNSLRHENRHRPGMSTNLVGETTAEHFKLFQLNECNPHGPLGGGLRFVGSEKLIELFRSALSASDGLKKDNTITHPTHYIHPHKSPKKTTPTPPLSHPTCNVSEIRYFLKDKNIIFYVNLGTGWFLVARVLFAFCFLI